MKLVQVHDMQSASCIPVASCMNPVQQERDVRWYLYSPKYDQLKCLVSLQSEIVLQLSFTTIPTTCEINSHVSTDSHLTVEIKTDGIISNWVAHPIDDLESILQVNANNYHHVPTNMRYGTYVVSNNSIVYVKDYRFASIEHVPYKNNKGPPLMCTDPRPIGLYTISLSRTDRES